MNRFVFALVGTLAAASLIFAACGGGSSNSTPAAGSTQPAAAGTKPATQGTQASAALDACKLITKAEVLAAGGKVSMMSPSAQPAKDALIALAKQAASRVP